MDQGIVIAATEGDSEMLVTLHGAMNHDTVVVTTDMHADAHHRRGEKGRHGGTIGAAHDLPDGITVGDVLCLRHGARMAAGIGRLDEAMAIVRGIAHRRGEVGEIARCLEVEALNVVGSGDDTTERTGASIPALISTSVLRVLPSMSIYCTMN